MTPACKRDESAAFSGSLSLHLDGRTVTTIVLTLVMAVLLLSAFALRLSNDGMPLHRATAVARMVLLPALLALVLAMLGEHRKFLLSRLTVAALSWRILAIGVAAGILMRIAAWAQITARGAFGWIESARAAADTPLQIAFSCPSTIVLATAIVSWTVLVPVTEELIHRGVLQSYFARFGKWSAIALSTGIFTLLHEPATYAWVALMGLLLGIQYWNSGFLWLPLIAHATYDGLIPFDELCLSLAWNPLASSLPLWNVGGVATAVFATCVLTAFWLAREKMAGPPVSRPGRSAV